MIQCTRMHLWHRCDSESIPGTVYDTVYTGNIIYNLIMPWATNYNLWLWNMATSNRNEFILHQAPSVWLHRCDNSHMSLWYWKLINPIKCHRQTMRIYIEILSRAKENFSGVKTISWRHGQQVVLVLLCHAKSSLWAGLGPRQEWSGCQGANVMLRVCPFETEIMARLCLSQGLTDSSHPELRELPVISLCGAFHSHWTQV